ncbi:hypothetical protein KEM52_001095 [Ascosphaera acerosa]|nr:hypothetical protein KEM52_001095 [Ascosphaera acerosa]
MVNKQSRTANATKAFNLTLRFKFHKTTILLSVPATESFVTIRQQLLDALRARGVRDVGGVPVPDDPADFEFALPVDPSKPGKGGWVLLEVPTETTRRGAVNPNPAAAGIKDSAIIALRVRKRADGLTEEEKVELELEDRGWDVVLPSLDDDEEVPEQ